MYNIQLTDYVPEPMPVSGNYTVCAHYYAAWKKGAAGLHNGFDDLHDYPERTPLAGYYDEEDPRYTDWEIKWAVEHGVNCFIHCWYRYRENVGKPITVNDIRCGHGLHEALFNARYQNYIKFAIMFETNPRWGATTPTDMLEHLMPFWMETYFKRENYLVRNNRPVLFCYAWQQLNDCFASVEQQREVFDSCRDYCRKFGFDGMTFAVCESGLDVDTRRELIERGFDFLFEYAASYHGENDPPEEEMIEYLDARCKAQMEIDPKRYIPTASCFYDPTPRTTKRWIDLGYRFDLASIWYSTPDGFRKILKNCRNLTDALPSDNPGKGIIMIDNWNEWDEGHFIAPSHQFGFRYLQAIREELTARDNLPDYRMPQDIGLSNFNHTWEVPDLGDVCKKNFQLN